MFARKLYPDTKFEICKERAVGHKMPDFFEDRFWPPSFKAKEDVFGRKGCRYKEGNGDKSFGKFSCDGADEFDCRKSPMAGESEDCNDLAVIRFWHKVECLFPVE